MGAIGMNEIMSIPTGILACDAMLKAAEVELVSAGCVCAGKYYIVVAGEVAAVRSAVEAGREVAENLLILSSSICTEEAMRATAALKDRGVSVQHMHVSTLKPFTDPTIVEALKKVKYGVVTIENQYNIGGLSSAVSELIAENGINKRLVKIGLPGYPHGASKMYLMKKYGIDAMHLVQAVEDLTGRDLHLTEQDLAEERFVDFLEV